MHFTMKAWLTIKHFSLVHFSFLAFLPWQKPFYYFNKLLVFNTLLILRLNYRPLHYQDCKAYHDMTLMYL